MVEINSGFLSTLGIGFDIIGAFFLASGFIVKSLERTVVESSDYMDGNPYRIKSAIYQRIDAIIGFLFLAIGFICQFLTYLNIQFIIKGSDNSLGLTILLLILFIFLAVSITSPIKRDQSKRIIREKFPLRASLEMLTKSSGNKERSLEAAKFYGEVIGVKQKKDESLEKYIKRIEKAYKSGD